MRGDVAVLLPYQGKRTIDSLSPNIIYRKIYLLVVLIIAIANNDTAHLPEIIALAGIGEQKLIPDSWIQLGLL